MDDLPSKTSTAKFIAVGGSVFGIPTGKLGTGGSGYRPLLITCWNLDTDVYKSQRQALAQQIAFRMNNDPAAVFNVKKAAILHSNAVLQQCGGRVVIHEKNC